MAIQFPAALDVFVNPTKFDNLPASSAQHHQQESDQNDAIEELEKVVGGMLGLSGSTGFKSFIMELTDDAGVGTGVKHKIYLRLTEGQPQFFINPTAEP